MLIEGQHHKPILTDVYYTPTQTPKPLVILAHGFKGFKDFACFDLVAKQFANNNFVFCKFNFSHNGTTPKNPTQFTDLEAFANNNFLIELDDLESVINYFTQQQTIIPANEINTHQIYLIGHSRGGGIVLLQAYFNKQIKKVVTWASVKRFGAFFNNQQIADWQKNGVMYVENTRTHEQMPLYWQLYETFYQNAQKLDIENAVKNMSIPLLIVHGTNDAAVPYKAALDLQKWHKNAQLLLIPNGNHVFGAFHPYTSLQLPADFETVVNETINFLK